MARVQRTFPADSAVCNLLRQQAKLRRPIIRYAYFKERLALENAIPTNAQLRSALQMLEVSRNGRPPSWTALLRHPVIVLMLGTIVYAFNTKILGAPEKMANWTYFGAVCWAGLVVGGLLLVAHTVRYLEPYEQWQFECCLRCYELERERIKRAPPTVRANH